MHHKLLTDQVLHRISTSNGCPIGVSKGCVVGERSHRPSGVGRAGKLGEGGFSDAVKYAARASANRACASQRNIRRKLIPVAWWAWVWRCLGEGYQRAVPDSGRA